MGVIWAKILENQVILLKISPKIEQIGMRMGHFLLKNWYFYVSTFKFRGGTSLPKPNLSTPGVLRWLTFHFYNFKASGPGVVKNSKFDLGRDVSP